MKERLAYLNFSAVFETVSHPGLLHKLRSTGVEGQFWSMVSEFLSDSYSACFLMIRSVGQLIWFQECSTVAF